MKLNRLFSMILLVMLSSSTLWSGDYRNFKVAVYCRAYEVEKMGDLEWLEPLWNDLERQVHVDKIYLETHRDLLIVDEETGMETSIFNNTMDIRSSGILII